MLCFVKKGAFFTQLNYLNYLNLVFLLLFTTNIYRINGAEFLTNNENNNKKATDHFVEICIEKCPEQNRTYVARSSEHFDGECSGDCFIEHCANGCRLWEDVIESYCPVVCNKTETPESIISKKSMPCILGCNDAFSRYLKWIRQEIGTTAAPVLVADSLTATSLSLEWEIPPKLIELTHAIPNAPRSYLVQWRYEELEADWKYFRNQSMGDNSTVRVENLQPYTKYRFRIALILSSKHDQMLISEQSVIISTLPMGVPQSEPAIVRAVAVDHTRISVSWEPGPFPNGPILSYALQIKDLSPESYSALKDIPTSNNSNYYLFEKLHPSRNYSISVSMRNAEGEGPAASTIVSTLAQPEIKDDEPQPTLILGAEYSILVQGSDILAEPPKVFYASDYRIKGMAIHIAKKLLFVSDEAGYIYKTPLEIAGAKTPVLTPKLGANFHPLLLSIDWLNDHLYILVETVHANHKKVWQISRCGLDGHGMTTAIAGLHGKPNHIEVDPFNGYLFWSIEGRSFDTGLFRLDLADISNGVKHEDKPLHLIKGENIGAFAVDHQKFRILVPIQDLNTVKAVSLNGYTSDDIRKNTQSPRFHSVKSLAFANNLFYWTNGKEVLTEEYHKHQDIFFHNFYPDLSNRTIMKVCVVLPSAQPIPVPHNPPSNVQALLNANEGKVSWQIPHLLPNKGKGAWQEWHYQLEVIDEKNQTLLFRHISGTAFTINDLTERTNYTFRAAAYTSVGRGPWSTEFTIRTLKSSHNRSLIWSSNEGLLKSDVIGEHIEVLIPQTELQDSFISDIEWFEDLIYIVINSTLKIYNQTSKSLIQSDENETVGSIAVDWIGRHLYWSSPNHIIVTKGNLNGTRVDTLPIYIIAKELKIDSINGDIYYSSGHAVHTCRLNGQNFKSYFVDEQSYEKRVMALTLDHENKRVYYIIKSSEGLYLNSAPLANEWDKNAAKTSTLLKPGPLYGPLTHFSDRFLWFQDEHTAVVCDTMGQNLAHIKNSKLHGLKSVLVIDPTHRKLSQDYINVIPETINSSTIKVLGAWNSFNISWQPIQSVNYGNVFYEIRIHNPDFKDFKDIINNDMKKPYFHYAQHNFPPYTSFEVSVRAYTFWGSSPTTKLKLHSPVAAPSSPTNPRVFVSHFQDPIRNGLNIEATFRWDRPHEPNGPILGYKIYVTYEEDSIKTNLFDGHELAPNSYEIIIPNLIQNITYTFQVQATTGVGFGELSETVAFHTNHEKPIPRVLISKSNEIIKLDLDRNEEILIVRTTNPAIHLAQIYRENRIFWIDENNELISFNGSTFKLITLSSKALSLTIDWIERVLYWSQIKKNGTSTIFALSLNRFETGMKHPLEIFKSNGFIYNLQISPINKKLYWIDQKKFNSSHMELMIFDIQTKKIEKFFKTPKENCHNQTFQSIGKHLFLEQNHLIWCEKNAEQFFITNILTKQCSLLGFNSNNEHIIENFAIDSERIYWTTRNAMHGKNLHDNFHYKMNISDIKALQSYYKQNYPNQKCLYPLQRPKDVEYKVNLIEKTEKSLTLKMPRPEYNPNCLYVPNIEKYVILYKRYNNGIEECNSTSCDIIESFENIKKIDGLKPFTNYQFSVGVNSYYGEVMHYMTAFGPIVVYQTAPGAPSVPEYITAEAISPTEALVQWMSPKQINSDSIWYEVHWQTENDINGVKNRQQLRVRNSSIILDNEISFITQNLTKLLPNQIYSVWIKAYTSNTTFSESTIVKIETFPEPENITVSGITPYSMELNWNTPKNISRYIIQYSQANMKNDTNIVVHDSLTKNLSNIKKFEIDNLQPKVQYKFSVLINYPKREALYLWPIDSGFIFETLGDRPSAPGRPLINHVSGEVYQVVWEPAKENGASIEEYSLEACFQSNGLNNNNHNSKRVPRSTNNLVNVTNLGLQIVEEPEPLQPWTVYYNGTDTYWIIKDLHPINLYLFRVRARNFYGWSTYSFESEPIKEPYVSPERTDRTTIIIGASISCFAAIVIGVFGYFCGCRASNKKEFNETSVRIPDVELATLRNMPRRSHFIQSTNILYNTGPLNESDIAALPQIKRDQITMTDFLGSGAFGEVYEGCVTNVGSENEIRVAIKTLRKGATDQEKAEFLQEAQLMSNFRHEHILRLIGVCLDKDSLYIIMELMQGGDLLSFLRQCRPSVETPSSLTLLDLVSMCVDVASGCRYLEEMHFVHRDLACRNCLVSSADPVNRVVKIGDFGLARDIYKNDYYRKEGGLLPVRWMSPESLVDGVFTSQSDIWAFGVLCWEILTLGQQPYPARNNVEVLHYVREGGRLERPTDCPEELYQLMLKCWSYSPEDRPTFRYCLEILKDLQEHTSDAIKITMQFTNWQPNGGIFNRTYLMADENHNHNAGTLKFTNSDMRNLSSEIHPVLITPPSSSSTTNTMPKYLELIYDEENDETILTQKLNNSSSSPPSLNSQQHQQPQSISLVSSDGYEMPNNTDLFILKNNNIKNRTFSNSSTVSDRSLCNNNLLNNNLENKILKVVLPPQISNINNNNINNIIINSKNDDCSSMDALLPNQNSTSCIKINNNNNNLNTDNKTTDGRIII